MTVNKRVILLLLTFVLCNLSYSQVNLYKIIADTVDSNSQIKGRGYVTNDIKNQQRIDTTEKKKRDKEIKIKRPKVPWKAAVMSGCLPGLGQFYNGKWWKVPIVWGAMGTVGYFMITNHISFIGFRDAYRQYNEFGTVPTDYSSYANNPTGLRSQRDYYQRTRDLLIIIESALWILNIVDASVDAHLSSFDISEDLTMQIYPSSIYIPQTNQSFAGLSLNFKFNSQNNQQFNKKKAGYENWHHGLR